MNWFYLNYLPTFSLKLGCTNWTYPTCLLAARIIFLIVLWQMHLLLFICWYINHANCTIFNLLLYKVSINFYMFSSVMMNWVVWYVDDHLIITIHLHWHPSFTPISPKSCLSHSSSHIPLAIARNSAFGATSSYYYLLSSCSTERCNSLKLTIIYGTCQVNIHEPFDASCFIFFWKIILFLEML